MEEVMPMKKVAFYTLGCKLNYSETSTLSRSVQEKGYQKVPFESKADVYVINTCSVTENADKKFKTIAKKAYAQNKDAFIVAVGCYAQLQPEELAAVDGVDLVLGASEKFNLTQFIEDLFDNDKELTKIHSCEIDEVNQYQGSYAIGDRTRAFLKVQDGCDYPCTYCTIPMARGISRSDTLKNVLKNAEEIALENIREIVLTGVNIGDYGKGEFGNKKHEHTFLELVEALDELPKIARYRISSIEPNLLHNSIINFVAKSESFVPHFHIPLQSGSDEILKKMKRRYLTKLYTNRITQIRQVMPEACIGVDVIVGFPGETEALFKETYEYLQELDISYLHVFTYSEREGTEAPLMPGKVDISIRKKRSKMLRILSAKKRRMFYEKHLGSKREVLFEKEIKDGYLVGFTDNYIKVRLPWNPKYSNELCWVRLDYIDEQGYVRISVDT